MAKRIRLEGVKKNNYFTSSKEGLDFVSTGCTILDCALGGGYVLGRMTNIVGDKSTAKTALATEALTNFLLAYPNGTAAYRESEAAFDTQYAAAMGLPIEQIDFGDPENPLMTVEDFARDLEAFIDRQTKLNKPGIYVLDSMDALSDETEMSNDIGKGTYGMAKPKQLSIIFRKMTRKLEKSKVLLLIVSQVRDNIGVAFGEKHRRSGGKALDFYATQIMWLAHVGTLKRTIKKVERPYGVEIRAKIKKNKIAMPFRECDFEFHFGYGVEDITASINWLKEVNRLDAIDMSSNEVSKYLKEIGDMSEKEYKAEQATITKAVKNVWNEIEEDFLPKRSKYG